MTHVQSQCFKIHDLYEIQSWGRTFITLPFPLTVPGVVLEGLNQGFLNAKHAFEAPSWPTVTFLFFTNTECIKLYCKCHCFFNFLLEMRSGPHTEGLGCFWPCTQEWQPTLPPPSRVPGIWIVICSMQSRHCNPCTIPPHQPFFLVPLFVKYPFMY